jgi:hypothetical protein
MGVALKIQQWLEDVRHPVKADSVVVSFKTKNTANDNFDIYCFKLSDDERLCCMKATD